MSKYAAKPDLRNPDDLPYGPGQSDYEHDGRDMEPMSDLGKELFSQAALLNEAARIHIKLGRQMMALEFTRCKDMTEVAALCAKESK